MSSREDEDTLRLLVQHVSRAFYEPKYTIILDQLARHKVLKDDDLAGRMGLQPKELNKVIAVLSNDCLVKVYRQNELKEGAQRSVGKQYYYIDYEHFCNVVKWRIARMRHKIDHKLRNEMETKGYMCPQCGQTYTPLEVDRLMDFDIGIFVCEICHGEVVDNENAANVVGNKDRMQRFNQQMRFIREGLQRSEAMKIPKFDVANWVKNHVQAEAEHRQKMNGGAGDTGPGAGLKVAGSGSLGKVEDGVGIVMVKEGDGEDEENKRKEREREAEQKRVQNALPAWHLKSTITGDLTALGVKESARIAATQAQTMLGDESLKGLGVIGASSSRSNHRPSMSNTNSAPATNGVDDKSRIDADIYEKYYATLAAAASTPGSSAVSVAPTPSYTTYADDEEERKPNLEYLESLNDHRKRSRSLEDVGSGGSKTPKMAKTESPVFTDNFHDDQPMTEPQAASGNDPLVYVNGESKPLSQVTEEDHELMTPEEYTAYFQVLEEHS